MSYRSPDPDLAYGDDPYREQRWDRSRFERYRDQHQHVPDDRERIRIEEREGLGRRGAPVKELDIEIDDRRGPRHRGSERDFQFREEERVPPSRRRMDFMEEPTPSEVANRALAPYRRRTLLERDYEAPPPQRRPVRPGYIRRQSSLDTFDRPPKPRYDDTYRIPPDVPIPLPIRRPRDDRYRERIVDEIQIKDNRDDSEHGSYEEDIHIRRRKSRGRKEESVKAPSVKAPSKAATSIRGSSPSSSSSSESSFEEVDKTEIEETKTVKSGKSGKSVKSTKKIVEEVKEEDKVEEKVEEVTDTRGKRGKTRMPKRLAHKSAIIELDYAFEEEDDFYIVRRALGKEYIDEIIELSKKYKLEEVRSYEAEDTKSVRSSRHHHDEPEEFIKTTTIIHERDETVRSESHSRSRSRSHSPATTVRTHRTRLAEPKPAVADEFKESAPVANQLVTLLPAKERERNRSKSEREIRREIAALEAERDSLRHSRHDRDREHDHHRRHRSTTRRDYREDDFEFIERVERRRSKSRGPARERDIVRVEKDRKGRMALVRSAH